MLNILDVIVLWFLRKTFQIHERGPHQARTYTRNTGACKTFHRIESERAI